MHPAGRQSRTKVAPRGDDVNFALFDHLIDPQQQRRRMVRPSALAVFRLMTSSNFVGCSMGRSAGLAPLRIFLLPL
jgi:hypothetical protein